MLYLFAVSLIWAFSFALIKNQLTGLDPFFVAFVRLGLSLLVFLPFLKIRQVDRKSRIALSLIGMLQYGAMYAAYLFAFRFLESYQVALFTIFTPIFVTLVNDILEKRFHKWFFLSAALAATGTGIVVYRDLGNRTMWLGFLFVQISNLCFAAGQIFYRKWMRKTELSGLKDQQIFGYLYFGAVLLTGIIALFTTPAQDFNLTASQVFVLLYLGSIASGLCFFLWNVGARKVNAGILSAMNNLKIPLAIFVSIFIFAEEADALKTIAGLLVIGVSVLISKKYV